MIRLLSICMELSLDKMEDKVPKDELVCRKESGHCRCDQLEDINKKTEARCIRLESEIQKRKGEYEVLEAKFKTLDKEKLRVEEELKLLKRRSDELNEIAENSKVKNKTTCKRERKMDGVVDLTEESEEDDEDTVALMMENSVLQCEKEKAENEVEVWKGKFRKLQSIVFQLEASSTVKGDERPLNEKTSDGLGSTKKDQPSVSAIKGTGEAINARCGSTGKEIGHQPTSASPFSVTPCKHSSTFEEKERGVSFKSELGYGSRARKHLKFDEDRNISQKLAPSTPGAARPPSISFIDIHASDEESDVAHLDENVNILTDRALEESVASDKETICADSSNRRNGEQNDEKFVRGFQGNASFSSIPRRKRAFNIVTSDSESEDDNLPISVVKRLHLNEIRSDGLISDLKRCSETSPAPVCDNVIVKPTRRRLVSMRQSEGKMREEKCNSSEHHRRIPPIEDVQDVKSEEDESCSEGESLSGFIIADDDSSVSLDDYASSESQNESDAELDFDKIISGLQRKKDHELKWEFEGDMLAAFGKDPKPCMKAVCALYRQQTADEKLSKEALHQNQRGFSKFDAPRGTLLGDFLTNGDPHGDLKKSVEELEEYDPHAVERCRALAIHYSKQLFEIYKKKEDPFFLPS